jgi:transposase-like protein
LYEQDHRKSPEFLSSQDENLIGYANGFKPKTVETRVGRLELAVPQTRGIAFYPTA